MSDINGKHSLISTITVSILHILIQVAYIYRLSVLT